ncbi:hypothetical protein IHE44_0004221 [Lamprotornis superbus]|uniref:3-beta hydroxysteroid dehydrogenase/isomerase domain-containing protein n=1 Tax=Lamprotornis superbus TaxID=245042 RepID=A0A835NMF2_9PASS|nr:hypothetical protein IHE44_0004221 [Lamprotornis superbus]
MSTDIRDYSAILAACEGADCVFHVASYGMSGTEQLHKKEIETVNINGTRFILNACKQQDIPRLVYTSSVNVVFGGLPIEDGDEESLPYFPIDKKIIERRLLSFKFADPTVKMNWIHVENFVQAHILAAEALTPEKNYIAVMNISVTHTFKIDKAKAQLGYRPLKYDFADSVDHYMKSRPQPSNYQLFLNLKWT